MKAAISLAVRLGAAATPALRDVVDSSLHAGVRLSAVLLLTDVGDASAWDSVYAWMRRRLVSRKMTSDPPEMGVALTYLLKEQPLPDQRLQEVVTLLRGGWGRLDDDEQRWIARQWPTVLADDTPESPPFDQLRRSLDEPNPVEATPHLPGR